MTPAKTPLAGLPPGTKWTTALSVSALTGHISDSKKQKMDGQQLANSSV